MSTGTEAALPPRSPRLHRYFARFLHGYFRRNFNAVRVAADGLPDVPAGRPLIVCTNHPSWWDPIMLLLLADRCLPQRRCYGPIDAAALERYPILGKLGLFGVDRQSQRSLRRFLGTCDAILSHDDTAVGLTAQGEFADARERPVVLAPGIGHLLRRHRHATLITIALEYPFWNERAPEALARFATVPLHDDDTGNADTLATIAATALTDNMDRLAALAATRDEANFHIVVDGRKGVGGFYDLARRWRSWRRGERFDPSHGAIERDRTP